MFLQVIADHSGNMCGAFTTGYIDNWRKCEHLLSQMDFIIQSLRIQRPNWSLAWCGRMEGGRSSMRIFYFLYIDRNPLSWGRGNNLMYPFKVCLRSFLSLVGVTVPPLRIAYALNSSYMFLLALIKVSMSLHDFRLALETQEPACPVQRKPKTWKRHSKQEKWKHTSFRHHWEDSGRAPQAVH